MQAIEVHVSFLIKTDFPLVDRINFYVTEAVEKGFINYWYQIILGTLKQYEVKRPDYMGSSKPLTFENFKIPLMIWAIGIAISLLVFIGEICITFLFNKKSTRKRNV